MKKKKEKKERTQPMETNERRRKRKERKNLANEEQWRRKKKIWSKVAADPDNGSLHVCLITKMPLKIELWKLKTAKMCFQFP